MNKQPQRLDREFFNRPTLRVARQLLGKFIVRRCGERRMSAMITEVEAYKGPRDRACHAYGGRRTPRVEPLYGEGGTAYVYFIYGVHWMLNFSTAGKGKPEGVLIRGVLPDAPHTKLLAGPGRVTQYLRIDKALDGVDVTTSKELQLEDRRVRIPTRNINRGPRIGIDFAGAYWGARAWRFWLDDPKFFLPERNNNG
jgi:DNA-3-methyladenine glycosylase